jgi:hypothetical protein
MTLAISDPNEQDALGPARKPITLREAPRREPPFDDEARHLRLVGPYDRALPFDGWPRRLRDDLPWQAPQSTRRSDLPDPAVWGRRMLIGVLETRAGRRSPQQLAALMSPGVLGGLTRDLKRGGGKRRHDPEYRVRSVHVCEPADGVAELAAVVQVGPRYRAIAARLEGLDGSWRCVRLQIG